MEGRNSEKRKEEGKGREGKWVSLGSWNRGVIFPKGFAGQMPRHCCQGYTRFCPLFR